MSIWKKVADAWCKEVIVKIDREQNAMHLTNVNKTLERSNTPPSALDAIFGMTDDDDEEF